MGIEIERKFLVANDAWRKDVISETRFKAGVFSQSGAGLSPCTNWG